MKKYIPNLIDAIFFALIFFFIFRDVDGHGNGSLFIAVFVTRISSILRPKLITQK